MDKQPNHLYSTELDCAEDCNFSYKIDVKSLLLDLKVLATEYYVFTLTDEEPNVMLLQFNNGQKFKLTLEEVA